MKALVSKCTMTSTSRRLSSTTYVHQVITVWSLDTAHQGLITHSAYNYLIRNYFNPAHLAVLEKTLLVSVQWHLFMSECNESS